MSITTRPTFRPGSVPWGAVGKYSRAKFAWIPRRCRCHLSEHIVMSFNRKSNFVARFARASTLTILLASCATSQESQTAPDRQPRSLYDIGHTPNWPHIGSAPTKDSPPSRIQAWPDERKSFDEALGTLKRSWSGEIPTTAGELKFQVNQYEDVVRTATSAGGYGNLILADTARRLDLALLSYYVILHSQDHAAVAEILNDHRVRLLDCAA